MNSNKTTRQDPLLVEAAAPPPEPLYERAVGKRFRCAICAQRGDDNEPNYLCHHCGRLFCDECRPQLPPLLRQTFQHQELRFLRPRGEVYLSWARWPEAMHCPYCVHYVPRGFAWTMWVSLLCLATGVVMVQQDATALSVTTTLLFIVIGCTLLFWGWRYFDIHYRMKPFFPIDGEPPYLVQREFIAGVATLNESNMVLENMLEEVKNGNQVVGYRLASRADPRIPYPKSLQHPTPSGRIEAQIYPTLADAARLSAWHHYHAQKGAVTPPPAIAGYVVLEQIERLVGLQTQWDPMGKWLANHEVWQTRAQESTIAIPTGKTRFGQTATRLDTQRTPPHASRIVPLTTELFTWAQTIDEMHRDAGSTVAQRDPSARPHLRLENALRYGIDWWTDAGRSLPRLRFRAALPVQVQARFTYDPHRPGRHTLELNFLIHGSVGYIRHPYIKELMIEPGRLDERVPDNSRLPSFTALAPQAQVEQGAGHRITMKALPINEARIGTILVRFDRPLNHEDSQWLRGYVEMGAVSDMFSQSVVAAYFDAFGHRTQPSRLEKRNIGIVGFEINLAQLSYRERREVQKEYRFKAMSSAANDRIVRRLEELTEVFHAQERAQPLIVGYPLHQQLPYVREISGRIWLPEEPHSYLPIVYHATILPRHERTHLTLEIEAVSAGDQSHQGRAEAALAYLESLLGITKPVAPEPSHG